MSRLSKKVRALILAGAVAPVILAAFLTEREGNRLRAYQDGGGKWTTCKGSTAGVYPGMTLTQAQCDERDKAELAKALALT